nr:reverse transcriptase domain-containing protein [Tanacetum cinerariifolium]
MSSNDASTIVTYTSVISKTRSWSIPTEDPYEEAARQALEHALPSPDPITGYIVNFDLEEDPKEDPADYRADEGDDDDESSGDDDNDVETEPFKIYESAATPPPPPAYRTTPRMSVRAQTPIPFPFEKEVARLLSLPTPPPSLLTLLSSPHTSPTYAQAPLGSSTITYLCTDPIELEDHVPVYVLDLEDDPVDYDADANDDEDEDEDEEEEGYYTAPSPRFEVGESFVIAARQSVSIVARGVDYSFVDIVDAIIQALKRRTMAAIEMVNLRVDTLRRYLSSLYTTHKYERVKARKALARPKAHNRALEARIAFLETQAHRQKNTYLNGDGIQGSRSGITRSVRPTRKCTYSDFLKCQPLNLKGTVGVVGLTQWFERIDSVFHISNYAIENQVKFANSTLHGISLKWWNTHVKIVGHDAAYGMPWKTLTKMMTAKYSPQNEIKKLEIEIQNLKVKGTDLASYTQRFQELALMCGRMFPKESDKVEKYVGGLPDMIQRSVMVSKSKEIHEAIKFATELMDKKILRRNRTEDLNLCAPNATITTKHKLCNKCKKGHYKKDCPKLGNKNQGNQAGDGNAVARAYVAGMAGTNPNSNVVTGMFLLNNHYASILFDTGSDRSFVSTAFSFLIDVVPITLNHGHDVELADGKIIKGAENFIVYYDASYKGLGVVLMQNERVIAYESG